MPHVTRKMMRGYAKVLRETGEAVTLLMPAASTTSTDTPLDIVESNASQDIANAAQYGPIYAHLEWLPLGNIEYGEGGRSIRRKAKIETSSQWMAQIQSCFAVLLEDGSIMEKTGEQLSEEQSTYTLSVEGYVAIKQ